MFDNATSVTIDLPPRPLHQISMKPGTTGSCSFAMSGVYIRPTSIERDATRQCIVCASVGTSGAIMFAPVIEGDESNISELVRVAEFLGAECVTIIVGEPNKQAKVVGWSQFDNIEQSVSGIGVVCPISIEDATPIDVYNHNLDYARKAWDNP